MYEEKCLSDSDSNKVQVRIFLFLFFCKSLGKCLQNSKTFIFFLEAHLNAVSNASWSIIDNAAVARRLTVSLFISFFFLLFNFCLFNSCLPWKTREFRAIQMLILQQNRSFFILIELEALLDCPLLCLENGVLSHFTPIGVKGQKNAEELNGGKGLDILQQKMTYITNSCPTLV